ncbi:MAG TPA: DNA recombination protein RmuC [Gemmatimonadales bacterium]|jgi:DNA recombination protein RmuC
MALGTIAPLSWILLIALVAILAAAAGWLLGSRRHAGLDGRVRDAFATLSSQALRENNDLFLALARSSMGEFQQLARSDLDARQQSIDQLVQPMREGLGRVDNQLQAFDRERVANQAALHAQLQSMAQAQLQLTSETRQLVQALRAPHVRGQWGELQLRRVVELAGMLEHCDFAEQQTVSGPDGRLRPDLIVHLPGDKIIVVDSKAPLAAYLDAADASDEPERNASLDRHARQVRDHITQLSAKDYAGQFTAAPDFVVLFLPGESFFSAACQRDPSLIEFAVSRGVIPASPTTLITVLKAVFYGWQQERIARNAEQIRDAGIELYGRMRVVAEHLGRIRKGLDSAVSGYNNAVASLESRVLPTVRKLKAMGAGTGDEIELLEPIDTIARTPSAPEMLSAGPDTASLP